MILSNFGQFWRTDEVIDTSMPSSDMSSWVLFGRMNALAQDVMTGSDFTNFWKAAFFPRWPQQQLWVSCVCIFSEGLV